MPAPLLLADLPWLLYRAHFSLPSSITGADGEPVNALLGTVNALLAAEEAIARADAAPRAIVPCTGAEDAAYRVRLYPPYHAHREPMPPALRAQWERAPALLGSLGWAVRSAGELEADDAMFSLAREEEERGGRALVLSGDRDLYGAVSDAVAVLEMRGTQATLLGPAQVRERYGVEPAQVADFIALRGDPSDGIPGAPGIGAKTAARLLREHGDLEALLAHAEQQPARSAQALTPRTRAALLQNAAELRLFKQLATLQRIELAPAADRATDFAAGAEQARKLGMGALARRLDSRARAAGV